MLERAVSPRLAACPPDAVRVAETGQPNFPGWDIVASALMAATVAALLATPGPDLFRRGLSRVRLPIVRLSRAAGTTANAVRPLSGGAQ